MIDYKVKRLAKEIRQKGIKLSYRQTKTIHFCNFAGDDNDDNWTIEPRINLNRKQLQRSFLTDKTKNRGFNISDITIFTLQILLHEFAHYIYAQKYIIRNGLEKYKDYIQNRDEKKENICDRYALKYYKRYI